MQRIVTIFIMVLSIMIISTGISFGLDRYLVNEEVLTDNIKKEGVKIDILNVKIRNEKLNISEKYIASAIITIEVSNNSVNDIELSSMDIIPYQNDLPIKYFVSTSEENINGFIGNLKSSESKIIKIGIGLHNTEDPIKLEIINNQDNFNEILVKNINIK